MAKYSKPFVKTHQIQVYQDVYGIPFGSELVIDFETTPSTRVNIYIPFYRLHGQINTTVQIYDINGALINTINITEPQELEILNGDVKKLIIYDSSFTYKINISYNYVYLENGETLPSFIKLKPLSNILKADATTVVTNISSGVMAQLYNDPYFRDTITIYAPSGNSGTIYIAPEYCYSLAQQSSNPGSTFESCSFPIQPNTSLDLHKTAMSLWYVYAPNGGTVYIIAGGN